MATNLDLFAVNVVEEGSPEWINQEWERMERENPDQRLRILTDAQREKRNSNPSRGGPHGLVRILADED
jgi:hypothetical protein